MGAHLLSLSELGPAVQHLASDACIPWVIQTSLGRSLARSVRALADEVTSALSVWAGPSRRWDDAAIGDLGRFPGYAVMALARRRAASRPARIMLWPGAGSAAAPAPGGRALHAGADPDHADLRMRAVRLLEDLREGLRIEARYRPLSGDLDARLFGPLDAAVRGRRARLDRGARRAWAVGDTPPAEPRRGGVRGAAPAGPISP